MSDLRHLQRLLNELQPAFLEITKSHGPQGAPVISLETYGKDHVTITDLPPLTVTSTNNDPVELTVTGLPTYNFVDISQGNINGPPFPLSTEQQITPSQWPEIQPFLGWDASDHGYTLADSLIHVTATDAVTGLSSHLSFNFIGHGPDPTVKAPPSQQQLDVFEQYANLFNGGPSAAPTIQQPRDPVHMSELLLFGHNDHK